MPRRILSAAWFIMVGCFASVSPSLKTDLYLLKKLLLYRAGETVATTTVTTGTLTTSITTTDLSIMVARTQGTPLMDELYNTIFTGNGTYERHMQSIIRDAVPHLRVLSNNTTDRLSRQRALVELAVKMQPMIRPLTANHPNLTAKVLASGDLLFDANRTARDGGGGGGGWGSSCCSPCCGGWGGSNGWGGNGWGGNDLMSYLLTKNGNSSSNDDLSQILPYLFGLIALLIMQLPT